MIFIKRGAIMHLFTLLYYGNKKIIFARNANG